MMFIQISYRVPKIKGLLTSKYGNEFCKNSDFSTTTVGSSLIASRCLGVAVIKSGLSVSYMPPVQ